MSESDSDRTDRGSDAPGAISDQNREEPSAPHGDADGASGQSEKTDTRHPPDTERSSQREDGTPGGAGESSQATGHPENAG